jgi:hypothetical protein
VARAISVESDPYTDHLEHVRSLLRERRYRRAVETIDRWLPNGAGQTAPVPVEDVRTYAFERLTRHGPAPAWRPPVNLRRGIPVSLRRPVTVDLRRLARPELERVLRWLLAEELRAAQDASRAGDYAAAADAAEAAAQIDDRSTRIAMIHARALYELAVAALNGPTPDLDDVSGKLHRAARLANRAAAELALRDPQQKLSFAIVDVAAIVERRRSRTAAADEIKAVVERFNHLVLHYEHNPIMSRIQVGNAKASLAQIRGDVERLSRQHPADTPVGEVLVDLRGQCARYKLYLERLGRSI